MKPVLVIPGTNYVICFTAEVEDVDMRYHFINECGWSEEQFADIEDFDWFSANVSLWHKGELLGEEFLGCRCHKEADEFWTTYACDYFADMVWALLKDLPHEQQWAEPWRSDLRKDHKRVEEPEPWWLDLP